MTINFSVVDLLRSYRPTIVPGCDVITGAPPPPPPADDDDRYRNATRFFTSAARPPSRDHAGGYDVTESRGNPDAAAATPNDVTTTRRTTTALKLVLVALDALVLLYRVTHVCRVVNRMRNLRSRDHRKYYYDDDQEDIDDDECASTERARRDVSGRGGLDHADEGLYQLQTPPSSSSSSSCIPGESGAACRVARSSLVGKLVLFAALVTSCHVTLHGVIDSAPVDVGVVTRLAGGGGGSAAGVALEQLDTDVAALYRAQHHDATSHFRQFAVDSLSNLSNIIQLINNRNISSLLVCKIS